MRLTRQQREQFERDGYLFFPGLFSADEVGVLNDAVPELYSRREAYNVREKDSDAVRTNFAAHLYSAPFARLARHPRMVAAGDGPARRSSSTCTSSRSTARWPSKAMSGSGTRTTAPGSTTT